MMISRSRIDIWEGKEVEAYITQADSPPASFAKMMTLCKLRLWPFLLRGTDPLDTGIRIWFKLGRIQIVRHNASEVPLHNMKLGCIWFLHWFQHGCLSVVATMLTAPDSDIGVSKCKGQVVTFYSIIHIITNVHRLIFDCDSRIMTGLKNNDNMSIRPQRSLK